MFADSIATARRPLTALVLILCAAAVASAGQEIHRGSFDLDSLSWEQQSDGTLAPAVEDARLIPQADLPLLPGRALNLLIPAHLTVDDVRIVPLSVRDVPLPGRVARGVPMISSEDVPATQDIFQAVDGVYPGSWNGDGHAGFLRGFQVLSLTVFPLRAELDADGDVKGLTFLEEYSVEIEAGPGILDRDVAHRERLVPGERERTERRLAEFIDNPEALGGYLREDGQAVSAAGGFSPDKTPSLSGSAVTYLIVTSEALAPTFETLAEYRTRMGKPAVVKSLEWIQANYRNGADIQETLRGFIRDAYQKWGVEYVLLGGDTDVVPVRYARNVFYPPGVGSDLPVDMYYACLDGNWNADGDELFGETGTSVYDPGDDCDMASEILLGRAPVSSPTQAADFIAKVIDYEASAAGAGFTNRYLFAAEELFHDDEGNVTIDGAAFAEEIYNDILIPYTSLEVVRMYEAWDDTLVGGALRYPGAIPESRQAVLDSLNTGNYNVVNQIGHGYFFNMSCGDANITVADASSLTNDNYFLLYALNCASAAFDYSCLMERFVQNPHGGSFASIGASRAAFPFNAHYFQMEFFKQLYQFEIQELGELITLSVLPDLPLTFANGFERWTLMNYTLLGDPATSVWLTHPDAADIAAPASLDLGEQNVSITVTSESVGVPYAKVTMHGEDGTYVRAETDPNGLAILPVVLTEPGSLDVDVSGVNLALGSTTISVATPTFYAALDSLYVVDDGSFGSSGNGNGLPESGETVALRGHYRDTGGAGGTDLDATLTSTTSGVLIIDGEAAVGDIPPGGPRTASDYFLAELSTDLVDGAELMFRVVVDDGADGSWTTDWTTNVLAPEIESVALDWEDGTFGNDDGTLDPGERVVITVDVKNFGLGRCDLLEARLRAEDGFVTIEDSVATWTDVDFLDVVGGSGQLSCTVVDTSRYAGVRLDFTDNHGREFSHSFRMTTPTAPTTLAIDNTHGSDLLVVTWDLPETEMTRGYHVYRSDSEAGDYLRINQDIVEGIAYFRDTDLATLTTYFYKVSTVDSALVESTLSPEAHASTAPPELGDFPLGFATETSSHNAVGDIDGDQQLEIVVCADEIYVWNADGTELFDGDGDAQTLGPITNLEASFSPMAPALVDLDGEPGLEIVAADWNTRTMHIFKADGTELPGWPQSTGAQRCWMAPAVGDIDGDGELEIVANNLAGVTLAWNIDGTEVADGDGNASTNGPLLVRSWEWGFSSPALFDVDGDDAAEIIFGNNYGGGALNYLHAYNVDGTEAPGFPYSVGHNSIACSPTIADLDGDDIWEIIVVAENDSLHVVQQDGTRYDGFPIHFTANSIGNGGICPSPAVGDFDQDGELEIVAVAVVDELNSYIHVIDTDKAGGTSGQTLPDWPVHLPGNSEGSPLVGDLNGDLRLDVLFGIGGSSAQSPDNLYAFTHEGELVNGFPLSLGGPVRPTPVITDIDADRDVDIVYGGWDLQIHVWDMPYPFTGTVQPWLTFQGSNMRDGVHRRVSSTAVPETEIPSAFTLAPIYPNPFNPSTNIRLYVPGENGDVPLRVQVHDMRGRMVRSLFDGRIGSGWRTWTWDGRDRGGRRLASGVYFLRASSGTWSEVRKMSLVK